jgi:hypothetical protein
VRELTQRGDSRIRDHRVRRAHCCYDAAVLFPRSLKVHAAIEFSALPEFWVRVCVQTYRVHPAFTYGRHMLPVLLSSHSCCCSSRDSHHPSSELSCLFPNVDPIMYQMEEYCDSIHNNNINKKENSRGRRRSSFIT